MTALKDESSSTATAECKGYCVDGCSSGGEPVPISELDDYDDHTGVVTGIGILVAALETALWLAFL